jgi:hypothetical protein
MEQAWLAFGGPPEWIRRGQFAVAGDGAESEMARLRVGHRSAQPPPVGTSDKRQELVEAVYDDVDSPE